MNPFTPHIVTVVGMTLVHFLWQGAILGAFTAACLAACRPASARSRYLIACAGLAAMTTAPIATFWLRWQAATSTVAGSSAFTTSAAADLSGAQALSATLEPWLPAAVGLWAVGVVALAVRLGFGWLRAEHVRRSNVHPAARSLQAVVTRLKDRLGIRRRIALFESPWIDAPGVIGWLRPTILLPIGALTGLSTQQIEAVLAHELAHIRRHDYLANSLQHLAETVLFYHPAVWWLSRQVRIEREHCCDDVAVAACGDALVYAQTLAALEQARHRAPAFALAATGGSLAQRVRRLIGPASGDRRRPSLPIAASVAAIVTIAAFGEQAQGQRSDRPAGVEATQVYPVLAELPTRTVTLTAPESTTAPSEGTVAPEAPRPPAQANGAAAPAPTRVGGSVGPPRKIRNVSPIYPGTALAAGISGVVILEIVVDPAGIPTDVMVLRSIPELDQAAIDAVRQWRYEPTRLDGVPVAVVLTVTVNFRAHAPLEARYAALPPEELEAQRRALQAEIAVLERQIAAAAEPSPMSDEVVRIDGSIAPPTKIRHVSPVYPAEAQAARVSGVVIIEVVVDAAGQVTQPRILRSVPMLDDAAVAAVRQWRYVPAQVDGVPTPVKMTLTVNFTLD